MDLEAYTADVQRRLKALFTRTGHMTDDEFFSKLGDIVSESGFQIALANERIRNERVGFAKEQDRDILRRHRVGCDLVYCRFDDPECPVIGTHVSHCCKSHGCKYGDRQCPVVVQSKTQTFPCEYCDAEARGDF